MANEEHLAILRQGAEIWTDCLELAVFRNPRLCPSPGNRRGGYVGPIADGRAACGGSLMADRFSTGD